MFFIKGKKYSISALQKVPSRDLNLTFNTESLFLVNFEHSLIVIVKLGKFIKLTDQVSMVSYFFSSGYNNYQKRQQQQEGGNGGSPRSQRHNFQTQQQSSGGRMSPQQQNQNQQQGQGQQAGQFQQQKKTSKCHISIELNIICP